MQNDKISDFINNRPKTFIALCFALVVLMWALLWIGCFAFRDCAKSDLKTQSDDFATIIEEAYDL